MNGIRIATTLVKKRKEKNITQEELARYIGVSKASVSKWETGASYPDIAFLPQLATYFDISIDELMDYQPQMTREEIRALYHTFTDQATERPFEDILEECRETIKNTTPAIPCCFRWDCSCSTTKASFPIKKSALIWLKKLKHSSSVCRLKQAMQR